MRPVCAEPMAAAVRASRRLFGLPSVVATAQQLPFADGAFDAAWCLGVLCTTSDKAGSLAELRRVLVPGARLGLLVFVAAGPLPPPLPEGNEFPGEPELLDLLSGAGFGLRESGTADLADSPAEWLERADAVDAEVGRRHGRRRSSGRPARTPSGWAGSSPGTTCARGSGSPSPAEPADPSPRNARDTRRR
ncbi:class I SAM-dependent methyltransferase [Blastococcus brunescens]|uniref:Class I SAM-dependent methyltransferase n=1 Tax=Blastococcus brunescens TaxID=1564165 RepID=A0ABZ1B0U7_9ACTN|nr:class I SAM-dependent methyltransferase [Blastococcus sp. BMG 8361]WRL64434.1 class I SAM-dependent methyltransferase [Blastococcus sp. BMG 8361]